MANEYDVIVIGAGPAGENVAGRTSAGGLKTVIVESDLVGGECSYWACMPSKALLRTGEAIRAAKRTPGARSAVTGELDVQATLDRRDSMASHWDDKWQVKWLDSVSVDLIRGHGRLEGERRVRVTHSENGDRIVTATTAVVIATGSKAAMPPIPGLESINPWDSRGLTSAKEPPRRLGIIGGGVVGVEMAQAWCDLGSEVTIFETARQLLPNEEPFAGQHVRAAFESYGINIACGTTIANAWINDHGESVLTQSDGTEHVFDRVAVATGRVPLTGDVGLEKVGLEPGKFIDVDDALRARGVEQGWLFAIGDVNGRSLLTHTGKYQARIAGDVILGKGASAWGDVIATPRVIFTDPNVAAVGLTEAEALSREMNIRTVEYPFGGVAGASTTGEGIDGTVKIVIDEDHRTIVGATFVGPGAGEMLHAATIAVAGRVTLDDLWHAIPAFPTVSEVWLRLLEKYGL